jgi:hypothetical protein
MLVVMALGAMFAAGNDEKAAGVLVVKDWTTDRKDRRIHDVNKVEYRTAGGRLHVRIWFVEELRKGIFTRATLAIDCDGKGSTDLYVLSSVGSRYRRLDAPALYEDQPAPIELRRSSYKELRDWRDASTGRTTREWICATDPGITKPEVNGREFAFSIPLQLLADHGMRYNAEIELSLTVEGFISEELISIDYTCADEGISIELDGKTGDWPSSGPEVKDDRGDLHPDASEVDLCRLRVEHGADRLFALVQVAKGGPGRVALNDDVRDLDSVTLGIEPLGAGYMQYREVTAWSSSSHRPFLAGHSAYGYATRKDHIEFVIARRSEQTRFRVICWTDAARSDRIPNGGTTVFRVPRQAWGDD